MHSHFCILLSMAKLLDGPTAPSPGPVLVIELIDAVNADRKSNPDIISAKQNSMIVVK